MSQPWCWAESEPSLVRAQIVERLIHDRQPDDRIDDIGVGADPGQNAEQQRGRMANGEQRHIDADVLHPIKEEDDAEQKQKMVVAGHHMLGAQINEGPEQHTAAFLNVPLVSLGDVMRPSLARSTQQ